MQAIETKLDGVLVLQPRRFEDQRGFFLETYSRRVLEGFGISADFVQDNHSGSLHRGVVRGLHFQLPPMAQQKLIRVGRGSIIDIVVDVRRGSPTFSQHVAVTLSAADAKQIYLPVGFAHGFVTLEPNTEVIYKVSDYYSPQHERGIRWNDPALAISWGIDDAAAILSPRDATLPLFEDVSELFEFAELENS